MNGLDADVIRAGLGDFVSSRLARIETFAEIDSTNSYLMQRVAPAPGWFHAALTDNQTAGRGRHGRRWSSPPGSGLCLSIAYTFAEHPENLAALTLAIGLGVVEGLEDLGAPDIQLKWPNDLIADGGKLGGILTETQSRSNGAIAVVSGIGLNVELPGELDLDGDLDRPQHVVDLAGVADRVPPRNQLAAGIVERLCMTCVAFEQGGFAEHAARWSARDWLLGRKLTVDAPGHRFEGTGAGVAEDGALLVDTGAGTLSRVTSGTVTAAENGT
jgi:BirA family biotin operon repressor/biotin-[acetyl-CoA-carboxylase] ligase